jgi:glycosyltransferase involved in cell wall biosynthesis
MSRNVIFVSHCDFHGNSAIHLFSIANVLTSLGHSCVVCVPGRPETVFDLGKPQLQVLDHGEAVLHGVSFSNGRPPDLVHAWTPRELIRKTTISLARRYKIPYLVHLEDNDVVVLLDELPGWSLQDLEKLPTCALDLMVSEQRIHPQHSPRFLAGAAGITVLIEPLLEFRPAHVPGMVFFPGYDAAFEKIDARDEALRVELGVDPGELLIVYTGSVHHSNYQEVRSLILAVALINRRGIRARLVKTGSNLYLLPELSDPQIGRYVIERGFVRRSDLPRLLAAADLLVQPGQSNKFNDYRFPSKLPEFLASGRPVILPRSNIGLLLEDGEEALVLERGDGADIANALQRLAADPELRARVGRRGRAFALGNLNWAKNIGSFPSFYDQCLAGKQPTEWPFFARDRATPKLIAFYLPRFRPGGEASCLTHPHALSEWIEIVSALPNFQGHLQPRLPIDLGFYDLQLPETIASQAALARRFGVFGFCFYYDWFNERQFLKQPLNQIIQGKGPDFPFCLCWANGNWTSCSDDQEREVTTRQDYGGDFSVQFIRDVIPILKDPRYIKVGEEPILLVDQPSILPDPGTTAGIWRAECKKVGIPGLHLVAVQSSGVGDPRLIGFDAAAESPPQFRRLLLEPGTLPGLDSTFTGHLGDYRKLVTERVTKLFPNYTLYRRVTPSWDDTPLCNKRARILVHSSPAIYQSWLRRVTAGTMAAGESRPPLIFVDAWNNWTEGSFLEPDNHHGYSFLEATRAGLSQGIADHLRVLGVKIEEAAISQLFKPE